VIYGGAGNDSLLGGTADDTLDGGDGWDIADYATNSAAIQVNLFTGAVTSLSGTDALIGIERVRGSNFADILARNHDANILEGMGGNDQIWGNNGDVTLLGGAGNDAIYGQGGDDSIEGGLGSDTYAFARGAGRDTIVEIADAAGVSDNVAFDTGLTEADMWLRHVGNDLEMAIRGSTDAIVLKDWYTVPTARVETFNLVSGKLLRTADVEGLVSAMAAYTPTTAGATIPPMSEVISSTVQTAISAAWHT
jgi:hypothetical protein